MAASQKNLTNSLRAARKARGLTQVELARRVGTTRETLRLLENGDQKLTVEWAERIAPHLGCEARDLLFPASGPIAPALAPPAAQSGDATTIDVGDLPALVERSVQTEGLRPFARRTQLSVGVVRSIQAERDVTLSSLRQVAEALGLELRIGPKSEPASASVWMRGPMPRRHRFQVAEPGEVAPDRDREPVPFDDLDAAREHVARRRAWLAVQRDILAAERDLPIDEVFRTAGDPVDGSTREEERPLPEGGAPVWRRIAAAARRLLTSVRRRSRPHSRALAEPAGSASPEPAFASVWMRGPMPRRCRFVAPSRDEETGQ